MEKRKQYAYWLCNLPGVGNQAIHRLLDTCGGTPEGVYQASEALWEKTLGPLQFERMKQLTAVWDLEKEYEKMKAKGIVFLLQEEAGYPERLKNIPDAPYGIFCKGSLPEENKLSVAVIGARDCSGYGSYVASELGKYLGEKGVQIVSGMARGIDGISQEAALAAGGVSFGVLGCGVDVCYPAQNRKLYERLVKQGGVLSTHPPGTPARTQHFPPRNRIVSGLADAVVVIEARNKSGTLITVDMALEQGKDVYVVPGRVTDRLSDGCNSLLKQGAGVVISPGDFYEEILRIWEERKGLREERKDLWEGKKESREQRGTAGKCKVAEENVTLQLTPELAVVYEVLDFYPRSIEEIAAKLPGSFRLLQVNTLLLRLCMENLAVQLSPGHFCRK